MTLTDDQIFDQMNFQFGICNSPKLLELVETGDRQGIGDYLQKMLTTEMGNMNYPGSQITAFSKNYIATCSANFASFEERMQAALFAGRIFSSSFEDEPIDFIVQTTPTWIGSPEAGCKPTDDPHREEGATTLVCDVRPLHAAETFAAYEAALKQPFLYMWQSLMHEGLIKEVICAGSPTIPTESPVKDDYPDAIKLDSPATSQILIGYSSQFKGVQDVVNSPELQKELALKLEEAGISE